MAMERYESIPERSGFARSQIPCRESGVSSSAGVCYKNAANYLRNARDDDHSAALRSVPVDVWDALWEAETSALRVGQLGEGQKRRITYKEHPTTIRSGELSSRLASLEKSLDKLLSEFPQSADELVVFNYSTSLSSAGARSVLGAVPSFVAISASLRTINNKLCSLDDFTQEVFPLMHRDNDISRQCLLVASRLDMFEKKLSRIEELVAAVELTSAASNAIFERIGARYGDTTRAAAM
ncbi:hypothetical protein, unknown function [Leishmania tarentolae]|uniref:Uncharacterized protein n=1 Tax=Leishmania tarentolae TaxID=5689 RepID=A0A640KH91_LEITA|nr:hypothetical protein, unknown function [Leishmania tarentolae]